MGLFKYESMKNLCFIAKIQTLKKLSIPKSDKARKKQVTAEIASLQLKLEEIRKQKQAKNERDEKDEVLSLEQKVECIDISSQPEATKMSRAKKKKVLTLDHFNGTVYVYV